VVIGLTGLQPGGVSGDPDGSGRPLRNRAWSSPSQSCTGWSQSSAGGSSTVTNASRECTRARVARPPVRAWAIRTADSTLALTTGRTRPVCTSRARGGSVAVVGRQPGRPSRRLVAPRAGRAGQAPAWRSGHEAAGPAEDAWVAGGSRGSSRHACRPRSTWRPLAISSAWTSSSGGGRVDSLPDLLEGRSSLRSLPIVVWCSASRSGR
jgi:hypothetical protein